ncbi:hypothetical protein [Deinococcus alpinitundrae]|uniref:hypothetical protein n=1 Tax=Deinococcus alpinitundrae TaxID=468913 RepID=UPI00137AD9A2|nr:hypothetical protein [Deinococcus alpinitundrae]
MKLLQSPGKRVHQQTSVKAQLQAALRRAAAEERAAVAEERAADAEYLANLTLELDVTGDSRLRRKVYY